MEGYKPSKKYKKKKKMKQMVIIKQLQLRVAGITSTAPNITCTQRSWFYLMVTSC